MSSSKLRLDFKLEMEKLLPLLGKIEISEDAWGNFREALVSGKLEDLFAKQREPSFVLPSLDEIKVDQPTNERAKFNRPRKRAHLAPAAELTPFVLPALADIRVDELTEAERQRINPHRSKTLLGPSKKGPVLLSDYPFLKKYRGVPSSKDPFREAKFRHLPHSTSLTTVNNPGIFTDACFEANLTVSSRANGTYVGTVVEHAASDCCVEASQMY
eukprot:Phypoly_transcript_12910.p1 GENE.Phypoly_transcript_12910~~Phypoly_transcript_12910.p1  ORF type:complete len:215 (+),score=19.48 Phypoly_transcript_12910:37-681(+)